MELFHEDSKLASIVNADYTLLPVLNRLGVRLGFGDSTISQICEEKGIDVHFFVETINVYSHEAYFPEKKLLHFPASMVIKYLTETHQYYINYIMPEIERLFELLLDKCNTDWAENELLKKFYKRFKTDFITHIEKEEKEMFPYILGLESVKNSKTDKSEFLAKHKSTSIYGFEKEHTFMDEKMIDLKNIIIKYLPPNYDLNIGNALLFNLFLFEKDMKNHSRIEDKILLPKVKQLEKTILQSK